MTGPRFSFEDQYAEHTPAPAPQTGSRARYDFAVAYPDPDALPLEELGRATNQVLQQEGRDLALYPLGPGDDAFRDLIVEKLSRDRGMKLSRDNVLLTSGSMQAINLITEALIDPGDTVVTEQFFYLGTLRTFRKHRANIVGVTTDEQGMRMDALEATLKELAGRGVKPKFIYINPTYQNPEGTVLPLERRLEVLRLSQACDVPIFEDDCYVDLRFEGDWPPAIHSLDETGRVLYVGSASKIVAPGFRLGWAVAPEDVIARLLACKGDGGTNAFAAMVMREYLRGHMEAHIQELRDGLRTKRDTMLAALGEYMGPGATWSRPQGGMFLWLRLPQGADASKLQEAAHTEDVGYISGDRFSPDPGKGRNYLRLCFGYPTHDEIREGIARLARFFQREGALA